MLQNIVGGDPGRSKQAIENEKTLRGFCKLINGDVYSASSAIEMMSALRSKSVLQRAAFNGPLEFGPDYSINVSLYSRSREATLPSLKKESMSSELGAVKMDRVYKNKARQVLSFFVFFLCVCVKHNVPLHPFFTVLRLVLLDIPRVKMMKSLRTKSA